MARKMKAFFRGLKILSQIFVHKEHVMEIGHPTDVRHVSHIGLGTADTCPSWMSEFRGMEELSAGAMSSAAQSRQTSWASLDFEQPPRARATLPVEEELCPERSSGHGKEPRGGPGKSTRRKRTARASSSPSPSSSSSMSRASSFATACGDFSELHGGFRAA